MDFETVNYVEKPLSASGLQKLLQQAGLKPSEILRTKEEAYKEYVSGKDLTEDDLLAVMAKHPELIQRPIVVCGEKAVLAREIAQLAKLNI